MKHTNKLAPISKRALAPGLRLEGETKAIEKKLEDMKAAMRKRTGDRESRLDKAQPSTLP